MPTTVNGIGTHYYGKTNLEKRLDVCEKCHRQVELESYETRLWFVVLFIPVIPLGRKQVLDKCPSCTYHRVVPLAEWHRIQADTIKEAAQQATAAPENAEAAMELHGTLVAFHKDEEARQIAQVLETRFGDRADVQFHLGAWHEQLGDDATANAHFLRALEIAPDDKAARRACAVIAMEEGDLARAHELLDFMKTPGDDQDPGLLFTLANMHQERGEHAVALDLYALLLRSAPALRKEKTFRKRLWATEEALGKTESLVSRRPYLVRRWALIGLIAAAVAGLVYLIGTC